jgi:hypothetical protein
MLSLEGTVCAFNVVYIDAKLQTNRLLCRCLSTTQVRSLDIVQSRKTVRPGFHIVCWYTCSILSETCSFLEVGCTVDECGHFCCYKQREHYRVSEKSPCVCKKHSEPLLCWTWEVFQDVSRARFTRSTWLLLRAPELPSPLLPYLQPVVPQTVRSTGTFGSLCINFLRQELWKDYAKRLIFYIKSV